MLVYFWRGKGREGRDVGKEGKGCGEGRDVGKGEERFGKGGEGYGKVGKGCGGRLVGRSEGRPHIHPPAPPPTLPSTLPLQILEKGVGLYAMAYRPTPFFWSNFCPE